MDAREIESLSMLSRGFQELRDVNAELSYNVILDILAGLNEYVWEDLLAIFILPFFFRQLAFGDWQECCCTATRADLTRTLPTQTSHKEERDDKSRARGDRGGRGHCRSFWCGGGRPRNNAWCRERRRRLTREAVTHRRTSLHAVARRPQNQMAKYIVVKAHEAGTLCANPLPPHLFFFPFTVVALSQPPTFCNSVP